MRPRLLLLVLAGCTASAETVAPPEYDLYFPTGMVLSPDERYLFVISADSDLRYSAGSILTLDLDAVDAMADGWRDQGTIGRECAPLPSRPTVLGCPTSYGDGTPSPVMVANGGVQIGSFGVTPVVQPLTQDGAPSSVLRLFATVRGDPSLTWVDFDESTQTLSCGAGTGFARCDQAHRLARVHNDDQLQALPIEPFDVAIDAPNQHVFVTHYTTGQVTLASAPSEVGSTPMIQDVFSTLFAIATDGELGAIGVAPRLPGDPNGLVYVTSRVEDRVGIVHAVAGPPLADGLPSEALARTASFYYDGLQGGSVLYDARNLVFTPDGNRAFIISRTPPSLRILDTSLDATGRPRNRAVGTVELCSRPANLVYADLGEGARVAVPCFTNGEVWILDPATGDLVATVDSGRGPNGIAVSPTRHKLYVGNYAEDTLIVIDEDPASPSQHHAVLRLGTERPVGQ